MQSRSIKKTAPGVGSTESGNGQMTLQGVRVPADDYITAFTPAQGTIASLLRRGHENALTCREISELTGLNQRSVTMRVHQEREDGAPILSDSTGFWLAEDETDVMRCIISLHARAGAIHKTAMAMERAIKGGKLHGAE